MKRDILRIVAAHGTIHKSALRRELGIGWGTTNHYLQALEREGIIATFHDSSRLWVHLNGISDQDRDLLIATAGKRRWGILWKLARTDLDTVSDLSQSLNVSRKVVRTHLTHLVESGIVERTGKHTHRYMIPEQMKTWVSRRKARRWRHDEP